MYVSTIAAVTSLAIAFSALLVTLAHAIRQYLSSSQQVRFRDNAVYGPMPRHARRVWSMRQSRFRVVYSIPQLALPADYWPSVSPHSLSHARGEQGLPDLRQALESDQAFDKHAVRVRNALR